VIIPTLRPDAAQALTSPFPRCSLCSHVPEGLAQAICNAQCAVAGQKVNEAQQIWLKPLQWPIVVPRVNGNVVLAARQKLGHIIGESRVQDVYKVLVTFPLQAILKEYVHILTSKLMHENAY